MSKENLIDNLINALETFEDAKLEYKEAFEETDRYSIYYLEKVYAAKEKLKEAFVKLLNSEEK